MKYPVVTICCSTRYLNKVIEYYNELTHTGHIVLAELSDHDKQNEFNKRLVDDIHLAKIDMSDEVHILVKNGEMGESVTEQCNYAMNKCKIIKVIEI